MAGSEALLLSSPISHVVSASGGVNEELNFFKFFLLKNLMIDFGLNVQEAGDAARWVHSGSQQPTGATMTNGGMVGLETVFSRGNKTDAWMIM